MALDIHDKLQIDTSIKLAFPGLDIKEIKQSVQIDVEETSRKRVIIPPAKAEVCGKAPVIPAGGKPTVPKEQDIVLIVVKLAKLDANKGVLPVLVSNKEFQPAQSDASFKLEGDATVAFWRSPSDKFKIVCDDKPLFVFNPNKVDVILDIYYGVSKAAPVPPAVPVMYEENDADQDDQGDKKPQGA